MKIFVENLHANASEGILRDLFSAYGQVLSTVIIVDDVGKPCGCGLVDMDNSIDGYEAIRRLNKINFMNQFLEVHQL